MIAIPVNQIKINAIRRKGVGKTRNRTRQSHPQAILIRPTTVIIDANNRKKEPKERESDKIMCTSNRKVADDSVYIEEYQAQTG